jgi:sugar/nucleoside kinase (ribokinase family)
MIPSPGVLDLVTAGEAFDDVVFSGLARLPREGEELKTNGFARSPGGGVIITAIAAARLGLQCAALTGVGRDAARLLRVEGVRLRNLKRRGEPVAVSVALSTHRDRCFVTFNGMNESLPTRIRASLAEIRARHVHCALHPARCAPWIAVIDSLRRRGTTTSWDFGWNPGLPRDPHFRTLATSVDYLFLNRNEAVAYARARTMARALRLWRGAPRCIVVKLGARGSRLVGAGIDIRAAATRVDAVDTTGAGDAFNAGFLVARLRGRDLQAALRLANRVGALSTRRAGGIAALPRPREVS